MRHKIWRWYISFTKKMHLLVHWWLSKTRINLCDNLHIVDFYKKGRWTYSHNCMPWKKKYASQGLLQLRKHRQPRTWSGLNWTEDLEGALSGLRQLLSTESHLKMMKNAFYFTWKAFFLLKIFKFLSWLFSHVEKRFH